MNILKLNKKGLDYVDWTISLSMFLIVVVAIFAFIKPGIEPAYSGEGLLFILEQGLMKDTSSQVKEVPVLIKQLKEKSGIDTIDLKIKLSGDWEFKKIEIPSSSRLVKKSLKNSEIILNCNAGVCKDTALITLMLKKSAQNRVKPDDLDLEAKCPSSTTNAECDAVLGSTVTLEGLDERLVNEIKTTSNYNQLKQDWGFPDQRDFSIYLDGKNIIGGEEPSSQSNVFVKEIKYWKIKQNSDRVATAVNLRVW